MYTLSLTKVKSLLGVGVVVALALSLPPSAGARYPVGPTPRCYVVDGTSCPSPGATQNCTDVCNNQLSCTCVDYGTHQYPSYYPSDPSTWFWDCDWEC